MGFRWLHRRPDDRRPVRISRPRVPRERGTASSHLPECTTITRPRGGGIGSGQTADPRRAWLSGPTRCRCRVREHNFFSRRPSVWPSPRHSRPWRSNAAKPARKTGRLSAEESSLTSIQSPAALTHVVSARVERPQGDCAWTSGQTSTDRKPVLLLSALVNMDAPVGLTTQRTGYDGSQTAR